MTTSLEYPRCNPTALRVTTHVASGMINSSIDLKNLAEHMKISDDILYVEFKNETENIIKGVKTGKQSKKKKKGRFWNFPVIKTFFLVLQKSYGIHRAYEQVSSRGMADTIWQYNEGL